MVLYKVCLQQSNGADREEEKGPVAAKQKEREREITHERDCIYQNSRATQPVEVEERL